MRQILVPLVWMLGAIALANQWCHSCYGCLEEERLGLLEIIAWLNVSTSSFVGPLGDAGDCCDWSTVGCDHTTKRVIAISASYTREDSTGHLCLNTSLFLPFNELRFLELSGYKLVGCSVNQGFDVLASRLIKLQELDLRFNGFADYPSLKIYNLTSLEVLHLDGNHFRTNNILHEEIGVLSALQSLSLANCSLNGTLPAQALCGLKKMKYLDLSSNNLEGFFPDCLGNLSSLYYLDLSHNNLEGLLPGGFGNWSSLQYLLLSHNNISGPLQVPSHPLPNIWRIDISSNNLQGQLLRGVCLNFPNLIRLNLADNNLTGRIPSCYGNESSLRTLDLSNNHLFGEIPEFTSICRLALSKNNFNGRISSLLFNSSILEFLYLDGNNFWGQIWDISSVMSASDLIWLDISDNHLTGMLPRWTCNSSSSPIAVDFSTNYFEGPIPREFCQCNTLKFIELSDNLLSSSLPSYFINLESLSHIHLSKNQLSGSLSDAFFYNSSNLVTLDLGNNNFTGNIPRRIDKSSELSVLVLKANYFDGGLPSHLCLLKQLTILDVSQNKFSGPLSSCLGNLSFVSTVEKTFTFPPYQLRYQDPFKTVDEVVVFTTKTNSYSYEGDILNFMSGIDLSNNNFTGEIPQEFGRLNEIHALNLSHNNLIGCIPVTFSNLTQIESLDLSHNNLNGGFPSQITQLNALEVFSVAYNNLSGKTPTRKNQFATFEGNSYEGNSLLCGSPLPNNCREIESPTQPPPQVSTGEIEDDSFVDMKIFYISFGVCYFIMVLTIILILYINPYWRHRWFYFIEECIDICYCLWVINFHKLFKSRRS